MGYLDTNHSLHDLDAQLQRLSEATGWHNITIVWSREAGDRYRVSLGTAFKDHEAMASTFAGAMNELREQVYATAEDTIAKVRDHLAELEAKQRMI